MLQRPFPFVGGHRGHPGGRSGENFRERSRTKVRELTKRANRAGSAPIKLSTLFQESHLIDSRTTSEIGNALVNGLTSAGLLSAGWETEDQRDAEVFADLSLVTHFSRQVCWGTEVLALVFPGGTTLQYSSNLKIY